MRATRKLNLKKDVLTELSTEDLTSVQGGAFLPTQPLNLCLSIQVCEITNNVRCLIPTQQPSCN